MGGFGSGGWNNSGRPTTADARSIDVNRLNREGCLVPGWRGNWQWTRDGQQVAAIGLETEDDAVTLTYRWSQGEGARQDVRERVPITWAPCRFGGRRPHFTCPGVVNGRPCNRSVAKLYGAAVYFLCRHCYHLTYPSQRERVLDRTLRRANRIRTKLGGEPGMASAFPPKPKWMRHRTYERHRRAVFDAECSADEWIWERIGGIEGLTDTKAAPKSAKRKEFWS